MLARPPRCTRWLALVFPLVLACAGRAGGAATVRVVTPLDRDVYRTDERIPLTVVRASAADLPAGELQLVCAGESDGSRVRFAFGLPPSSSSEAAPAVEHLWVDGRHLAPGRYTVTATFGGSSGSIRLLVVSHVRRSTFRTIAPATLKVEGTSVLGDDGLGFDTLVGAPDAAGLHAALGGELEFLYRAGDEAGGAGDPPALRRLADDVASRWAAHRSWPNLIGIDPPAGLPGGWQDRLLRLGRREGAEPWPRLIAAGLPRREPAVAGRAGNPFVPAFRLALARATPSRTPEWVAPAGSGQATPDADRLAGHLVLMAGGVEGFGATHGGGTPLGDDRADAAADLNRLSARLGPALVGARDGGPAVALLVSRRLADGPAADAPAAARALAVHVAARLARATPAVVTDDELLAGNLARRFRAILVPGPVGPDVAAELGRFAAAGGVVLLPDDVASDVAGATRLGAGVDVSAVEPARDGKPAPAGLGATLRAAGPLARAIDGRLEAAGMRSDFEADAAAVLTGRLVAGEVEYLLAVNASHDEAAGLKPAGATLSVSADDRPIYDAVLGGTAAGFNVERGRLRGAARFGPGQLRVFARPPRPIGGARLLSAGVDAPGGDEPARVAVAAAVVGVEGRVVAGSVPVRVRLTDPFGVVRYDLYRATTDGVLRVELPLAANDPAGAWTVAVRELLADTSEVTARVEYRPPAQTRQAAGLTTGAMTPPGDAARVADVLRDARALTAYVGTSDPAAAAADRLKGRLAPWGVRVTVVPVARPGPGGRETQVDPATPAVLVGSTDDNSLLARAGAGAENPLQFRVGTGVVPGRGHGLIAWLPSGVAAPGPAIAAVGTDAAGLSAAVDAVVDAVAGRAAADVRPADAEVTPATKSDRPPEAGVAWRAGVPDRVVSILPAGDGLTVYSHDGSVTRLDPAGRVARQEPTPVIASPRPSDPVPEAAAARLPAGRPVRRSATAGGLTAVAVRGGTVFVFAADGSPLTATRVRAEVTDLAWFGDRVVVGLADGGVVALRGGER